MERKLTLATSNNKGLAIHSQEIQTSILNQDKDILFVSETHTNKNYLGIAGYTLYYIMHPDSKTYCGTALIIRSSIKHYEIDKHQRDFLQVTSTIVEAWSGCITTSAIY